MKGCGYTGVMLRYAITDGASVGSSADSFAATVARAGQWAAQGIDYVQLREKQLEARELIQLAAAMMQVFREHGGQTKLLINGRPDIAVAAGADGVHLTSRPGELTAEQVRRVFAACGREEPVVSASCHTVAEVQRATSGRVDLILFGPVFEKRVAGEVSIPGVGLEALWKACEAAGETPLLALGGITFTNASKCLSAGASGMAGIRVFM